MTDETRTKIFAFEKEVDAAVAALPVAQLPARSHLANFHLAIFYLLHRASLRDPRSRLVGDTLAYRISYLLPSLGNLAPTPFGSSASDAIGALIESDSDREQVRTLIKYAHFCELMPGVHRNWYDVELIENGFRFTHPTAEFALAEATDILISELAQNFIRNPIRNGIDSDILVLATMAPHLDNQLLAQAVQRHAKQYAANLYDQPLITDAGMIQVFGYDCATFLRIQSAVLAFAEVMIQLAMALWNASTRSAADNPAPEALEWISVCLKTESLREIIAAASEVEPAALEAFLDAFTYDYGKPISQRIGGEGFMPPFVQLSDYTLFSGDLIHAFCHTRNAITSFMRKDQRRFDNLVSHDLEPVLLEAVRQALALEPTVTIHSSHRYALGELDLLVIDPETEHVIVAELKAPIPPQGARSTDRLAARIREGLDQLRTFQSLSDDDKIKVVHSCSGYRLSRPTFHYAIIARSCFGAHEVWQDNSTATPLTLPLIRLAVRKLETRGGKLVPNLIEEIRQIVREFLSDAKWRWEDQELELSGQRLLIPQLEYDRDAVDRWLRLADIR